MIVVVLVDGVGIGSKDPGRNPLARRATLLSHFVDGSGTPLPRGGVVAAADATLGVAGRPQSATGHATLLSGVNAAQAIGHHLLGFPNEALRRLLRERNLFLDLQRRGLRGTFANAFRAAYLEALELPHATPSQPEPHLSIPTRVLRPACSTVAYHVTATPFRTFDHLRHGAALYHDITSHLPRLAGCDVPRRTPEEAAELLLGLDGDLAYFEFFQTDEAGHAQDFDRADEILSRLDELLRHLVEALGPGDGLLVVSDHGNLEDLSIRQHTTAQVPILGFGAAAPLARRIRSIVQVQPALLSLFPAGGVSGGGQGRRAAAGARSRARSAAARSPG